jgi:predicted permease
MLWRRAKNREQDLERELAAHLEAEAAEQRESGLPPQEALYAARRALGNTTLLKEQTRDVWRWTAWETFAKDVLYSVRMIRKNPGFAVIAILTLALGIGANTAIFSVLYSVLLRRLPYPQPDRLIRIWQSEPRMSERRLGTAPPEFAAYRDRTRAFASLAGYQPVDYDLTGTSEPEHIRGCAASANLFETLGVSPLFGRVFTTKEELPGAPKVVVLSYRYWRNRYAGNPHVVGTLIRLNEQPYQVIGVMPRGFIFPSTDATPGEPPAVWTPLSFTPDQLRDWASSFDTSIVARLRNGVSLAQARDDVRRVAQQFQQEHRDIYSGNVVLDATVEHWAPEFGERVQLILSILCGAVAFVLLVACANVANLLLARAATRSREISIRRALGASPARLMRQVLAETAILTIFGCAAGCAVAYGLIRILETFWTSEMNLRAASLNGPVLLFALGACALTCILCGFSPAWAVRKPNVSDALKQSAKQSGLSRAQRRLARLFTLSEIACSLVLMIGSGLLLKSFIRVLEVPLGFDPEHALIIRTTFNRQRYSAQRRHEVEGSIAARLSSLPGVAAVAITTHVPLADERQIGFVIDGAPPDEFHWADNALVSGDYFKVMRIPLLAGRTFSDHDTPQSPMAAVINQTLARQYWPGQDSVGKGFRWGGRHITVIGVVGDIHIEALDKPIGPQIYNSLFQIESGASTSGVFLLRARGSEDPMRLANAAKGAIWSVDHGVPILGYTTLHNVVSTSLMARRASVSLMSGFALLAIMLSLIGIYGVLARAVVQRTQEIGIRLAVGARPVEITRLVLREGMQLATTGIILGLSIAGFAGSLVSRLLFGVHRFDPLTYVVGCAVILLVSVLASYLPARRAARVDPIEALRYE